MAAILGAVSPAVVVPRMLRLMEEKRGTEKSIPQLIMAGASCDDIFVIVLFTTFVGMAQGGNAKLLDFVNIPVSILFGVAVGAVFGLALALFFERAYARGRFIRNSIKVITVLGVSFLLIAIEAWVKRWVAVSGLLAVVGMACVLKLKSPACVTKRMSEKFGKLWLAAGVAVCLIGTPLNIKERLFCIIAYLPKATVQAAIGSVPLSLGLSCGSIVLSVAVLGILITAPLGALGIDLSYKRLLNVYE